MATNNMVNVALSGTTGAGSFAGSVSPVFTTPNIGVATCTALVLAASGILDSNGATMMALGITPSSVNFFAMSNAAAAGTPIFQVLGSDTNISMIIAGKGTGGIILSGTGTNDSASAGIQGEYKESIIASASAVTAGSNVPTNLTSVSLTAGDWDVWGNLTYLTGGTVPTSGVAWLSSTSATLPDASLYCLIPWTTGGISTIAPSRRFSLSGTTTVYLSGYLNNTSGTGTFCGGIYARRRR